MWINAYHKYDKNYITEICHEIHILIMLRGIASKDANNTVNVCSKTEFGCKSNHTP